MRSFFIDDDACEGARAAREIMQAVSEHWNETRHGGDERFSVTKENPIVCACFICGAVLWEEKPDA